MNNKLFAAFIAFLCAVSSHAQSPGLSTLVVPRENETRDGTATGGGGSGMLREVIRLQSVYNSELFPEGVMTIREIRLRPSAVWGNAFTSRIPNLQINLSTTPAR